MFIEKRIKDLGFDLPKLEKPMASYVQTVKVGNIVYVTGQPPIVDGKLLYTGKFGEELTVAEGVKAAEICALNSLSAIKEEIDDLDKIKRIIKVNGFLNCTMYFADNSKIVEGASQLLIRIFGEEKGSHTRTSLGFASLPFNSAVAIELTVEVED